MTTPLDKPVTRAEEAIPTEIKKPDNDDKSSRPLPESEKSIVTDTEKSKATEKSKVIVKSKKVKPVVKAKKDVAKKTVDATSTTQQTMEEFKASCEALVEAQIKHRVLQNECRQVNAELQKLRDDVIPFLLSHKRNRVDCTRLAMYISTRVSYRPTTIGVKQLYEIIEETLGKESRVAVQHEAEKRRQQKREVRETRIMPLKAPRKRVVKTK